MWDLPGVDAGVARGDHLHVYVLDHSIEVVGRVASNWVDTCFGMLRIELHMEVDGEMGSFEGRRLEDVLIMPANLGRGWIIDQATLSDDGRRVRLAVWTGVRRYRTPWSR